MYWSTRILIPSCVDREHVTGDISRGLRLKKLDATREGGSCRVNLTDALCGFDGVERTK